MTSLGPESTVLGTHIVAQRPLGGQAVCVQLADGRQFVVKGVPRQQRPTWRPGAPWTELVAVDIVSSEGGPVPPLAAADVNAGWMLRAYAPGPTLGSVLGDGDTAAHFPPVANALSHLSAILTAEIHALDGYITPTSKEDVLDSARSIASFLTPSAQTDWLGLLNDVLNENGWHLGPTDVRPDNIIITDSGPMIIDLATIGWDYAERRLVGYTQSADPVAPSTWLTEVAYAHHKTRFGHDAALRLAVFDHLFWGLALVRLLAIRKQPDSPAVSHLLDHWTPDDRSWDRIHRMWARPRLDEPRLQTVRNGWDTY